MTEPPPSIPAGAGPDPAGEPLRQVVADLAVIAVFALALVTSRGFADVAVWFPTAVGIVGIAAGAGKLGVDLLALRRARADRAAGAGSAGAGPAGPDPAAAEPAEPAAADGSVESAAHAAHAAHAADLTAPPLTRQGRRELLVWIGLLVGLLVLIRVVGMVPAAALWLPAVLWWRGRRSLLLAAGGAVGAVALLMLLEAELNVRWPEPMFDIYGMLT